jgi:cell fate regulator YaaT (PSP1 superfamily)
MRQYLVRIGLFGHVGRFRTLGGECFPRSARVVCRTARGLETGEVLAEANGRGPQEPDGALLRRMTAEDELLVVRLEKNKQEAQAACLALLAEQGHAAVLLDVEPLFDGRSLFFYFLGDVSPEVEAITERLAAAYDAAAGLSKFAETMIAGCGPDCGTKGAGGCASGGCSSCAVVGACKQDG